MPMIWWIGTVILVGLKLLLIRWWAQGGQFKGDGIRLAGKIVIITGCNTGIGKETAIDLARRGAKIYMACRDEKRAENARQDIIRMSSNNLVFFIPCDLASFASIHSFVEEFLSMESQLHILINNAGIMYTERILSLDGFEMQLATNHLGHFLLTNLLLDTLKSSAPSRIITVSSMGHRFGRINRLDLNSEKSYDKRKAYCQSKLANILFTRSLCKRLFATGVTANSLHPGVVNTELPRHMPVWRLLLMVLGFFLKTPESGAQTTIMLAADPDLEQVSGKYFEDCQIARESYRARDDELAEWLWNVSETWVGLKEPAQINATS